MSRSRPSLVAMPWYPGNPWQGIMYRDLPKHGVDVDPWQTLTLEHIAGRRAPDLLHINWTAAITRRSPGADGAMSSALEAVDALDALRARGTRLLWTVHNVLPHEHESLAAELILARYLAAHADVITIMNPDTAELVRPLYPLPADRVVEIAHPSYLDVFPSGADVDVSRAQLGLEPDDTVLVFVGLLRPYKGLQALVDAVPALRPPRGRLRILIEGEPGPGFDVDAFAAIADAHPEISFRVGRVEESRVATLFSAADAAVLLYRAGLNVSVVELAAGFGCPSIVLDLPENRHLRARSWVRVVPPDGRLAEGLNAAMSQLTGRTDLRLDAHTHALGRTPARIGAEFADLIDRLLAPDRPSGDR